MNYSFPLRWLPVSALVVALVCQVSYAAMDGQPDLDAATELQVQAKSMADLEKVADLCEKALQKGLDEANEQFAQQLLTSTLFQHATQLCEPILNQTPINPGWRVLRQFAMKDLNRVLELSPDFGEAHLLMGQLLALPGGDLQKAMLAAEAAIEYIDAKDDPQNASKAFVLRAQLREDVELRLKDYDRAIEVFPGNVQAWQGRALTRMSEGQMEEAIDDFTQLLEKNADNLQARLALVEALTNMEKYDQAREQVEKAIEMKPDASLAYSLRARLHLLQEDGEAAMQDLDKAIELEPRDIAALLIRARLHLAQDDPQAASDDIGRVLILSPDLPQALLIRSMILSQTGRMTDAIAVMQSLLERDPKNAGWQMQLAGYYLEDKRPSKAIDIFTKVLEEDDTNLIARQARADTLLSIGKHAEAIEDFEIALKQAPEDDSVLNNLAWVLATSPEDKVRDGKRAIELATKACEVTKYEMAHILSTLAAAYAETGDFENAIKWSQKAVDLGVQREEVDEQLKNELKSYQEGKPWRERQTVEEKEEPLQQRRSGFEA